MALFRTLPTPTNDLLPNLMVEVCVVLAPNVNVFLNSRKQGLLCWRSLSFFLSSVTRIRGHKHKGGGASVAMIMRGTICEAWACDK